MRAVQVGAELMVVNLCEERLPSGVYIDPTDGLPETEQWSAFAVAEKAKMGEPNQIPSGSECRLW
jgi:hypothetical protein